MLPQGKRLQLVAEANSTRSPDSKKTYKKRSDLTQSNINSEKQHSRKKNSSSERKAQSAESKENEETRETADKKKETYYCKFCKRDGHKISTCRYKQRKEKAQKQRMQAQKEKTENNFKEFLKQQLQMLIKEVKEALNPTLMLNEILKRFETHEDKVEKIKQHYENQMQLHKEQQNIQLPDQQHEQSTNENQHDDNQYTWERQFKNPTQNSKPEDAWGIKNEHSSTGFGETAKAMQNQTREEVNQQQDEDDFTWEYEIAHSKNQTQTQNSEPEDAWGEETEAPTGFEEAIQIPIKGIIRQSKIKKVTHEPNKKTSRSDQKRTKADTNPHYWYINTQERKNNDDPIVSQAWIITSKNQQSFTARKLWLDKETKKPRSKEFTALQVKDFRRLNESETRQANREIKILNK